MIHLLAALPAAALPPAELPSMVLQPPALHTVELLATRTQGTHTVRSGDTVYGIAAQYRVSPQAIVRANGLRDNGRWIMPGQVLSIPGASGSNVPAVPAPSTSRTSTPAPSTPSTSNTNRPTATPSARTVTVRAGDTLSHIAIRNNTTVRALQQANNLRAGAFIHPGQVLRLPGAASTPAPSTPSPTNSNSSNNASSSNNNNSTSSSTRSYTVRSGDTLSGIASRHNTTVAAIARASGINAGSFIFPGQRLTIPGAGSSTSGSSNSGNSGSGSSTSGGSNSGNRTPSSGNLTRPYDEHNIGNMLVGQNVPNTFLHYTYSNAIARAAAANRAHLASVSAPSQAQIKQLIVDASKKHGVDHRLMLALSFQESGWNQRAVSPANAIGAMQVIPSSGQWASNLVGRQLNLLDPADNVEAGVVIMKALQASAASGDHAIGGYYQGLGSVRQYGLFADTQRYVANIKSLMRRM
ncbi:LysM peptidoglycan-binding domain-containing protein [Ornithinimicrobium sp. Y1694]|uniref:lytic transglycosylase domain-containing protein n=1 Tax=Ornithinimicrobium sp. Y1694 TaxID=3418590 RepID=UPI003CEFCDBD